VLKVGLTGGIACGKTTVLEMFASRGAHTLSADNVGTQLMQPGQSVYAQIVEHFGREILNEDATINRPLLAEKAFAGRIEELNALVHPPVIAAQDAWIAEIASREPRAVAIVEAALMVEAGSYKRLDRLITVVCRLEQRAQRFAQRTGMSLEAAQAEVTRRMDSQLPDAEKIKVSDYVIDSSGTLELVEAQVDLLWRELIRLARLP
jgi:dephospho-CoA kinase